MRALIVLPSFNERENICNLIQAILDLDGAYQVCVVDDSSPDGTSPHVAESNQKPVPRTSHNRPTEDRQ